MVYEIAVESLDGRDLEWMCGTKNCCNPIHLSPEQQLTKAERRRYKREWARQAAAERPDYIERRREVARLAYARDPEKAIETARAWQSKNPEYCATYNKGWAKRNPDKVRESAHRTRLRRYGITAHQFDEMLVAQRGLCAICSKTMKNGSRSGDGLHIDHCHKTGAVRGLLCGKCNLAIGLFSDDPTSLAKAIDYLKGGNHGAR
jgi:hypothetical protein